MAQSDTITTQQPQAREVDRQQFVEHGQPGNGPVTYHSDHLASPCCATVTRQAETIRWAADKSREMTAKLASQAEQIERLQRVADAAKKIKQYGWVEFTMRGLLDAYAALETGR